MSLLAGDLTTITTAQSYVDPLPNSTILQGLITRISRAILSELNRSSFVPRVFVEQWNGTGTQELMLPNWPVLTINSLSISGISVPPSPPTLSPPPSTPTFGYRFQPWNGIPPGHPPDLTLVNLYYLFGHQNVLVNYTAGYQVTGEVPNAASYTPLAPYGIWSTDQGVMYSTTKTSLTPTTGTTPSVGQYVPPIPDVTEPSYSYIFNSADISTGLILNYGYVPADVEQVALELIAERASYRRRVGVKSQSLAGQENLSYDLTGISGYVRQMLQAYISVLPPNLGANT